MLWTEYRTVDVDYIWVPLYVIALKQDKYKIKEIKLRAVAYNPKLKSILGYIVVTTIKD